MHSAEKLYDKWKTVTEADFVSLFIKTWFAYISTLRTMFPEAYNRRGDGKYLSYFKDYYKRRGYKSFIIDENIMNNIESIYRTGRNIIIKQYPEYYLWDFYHINDDFNYTYKDIPDDKKDCLIFGVTMHRNRGTNWSFIVTGFVKLWGEHYGETYNENLNFKVNISDCLNKSTQYIKDNPKVSEQNYLTWLLTEINNAVAHAIVESFSKLYSTTSYGKRITTKIQNIEKQVISLFWNNLSINRKDETAKTEDELHLPRNTYIMIQQVPITFFEYHMTVPLSPDRNLNAFEETWYNELSETRKQESVIWFLNFVYRLRNALFHEIIDPLDEQWQTIFKNSYLVLKEIVDMNIEYISKMR